MRGRGGHPLRLAQGPLIWAPTIGGEWRVEQV